MAKFTDSATRFFLGVSIAVTALAVTPALAQQTSQQCLAGQLRGSGRACSGLVQCYVKAVKKGVAPSQDCIDLREPRLDTHFSTFELLGNCLVEDASGDVYTLLDDGSASLAAAVGSDTGKCGAIKLKGLGKNCGGQLRCRATAAGHSEMTVDPTCLAKQAVKLDKAFTKAERKGSCSGDKAALATALDAIVENVFATVRGSASTTTTTTTTVSSTTSSTLF
jgi:hypothetical protein